MTRRPARPEKALGFYYDLPSEQRSVLSRYWRILNEEWWANQAGYRRATPDEVKDLSSARHLFCAECYAAGGDLEPVRGLDSHGDCAADGETPFWVVPIEQADAPNDEGAPEEGGDPGRPFSDLRTEGLLWYINRVAFHPFGFALALHMTDDQTTALGWSVMGDGSEPWSYGDGIDDVEFAKVQAFFSTLRTEAANGDG